MFKELNNLKIFFEEPQREFHLREISRILKKNPVTIKKHLENFVKENILLQKKERGLEIYSSNNENSAYKKLKKMYNEIALEKSKLIDFLNNNFNLPTIILFGSYQKGEDSTNSDIDLFILTETKKQVNLKKFEKILSRKIQLHIRNQQQFNKDKKDKPDIVNSIINGTVMRGFLEVI